MAFTTWDPTTPSVRGKIGATILKTGVIELTVAAYRALGEPTAITVGIDAEQYVLRIRAASPDAPKAIPVRDRHRFAATGILQHLGIRYRSVSTACPGRKVGPTELHIDVSAAPAAYATVSPIRGAA